MSHEITTTRNSDGDEVAFYAGEIPAWHQLGTVVGKKMTAQESLEFAHLAGWDVRKVPVWADLTQDAAAQAAASSGREQKRGLKVFSQYATVFTNPVTGLVEPIAIVGENYTAIQSEAMAEFGQAVLDELGPNVNSVGSLQNFRKVFMSIELPQTMTLEGKDGELDITKYYLTLFNSFDGSSTFFGIISTVRVVCANTARAAIAGAVSKFSIRHTSGWKGNVAKAREALKLAYKYEEAYETKVREELFGVPMTLDEMKVFATDLTEVKKAKEGQAQTQRQNVANGILKLYVESPTIKGTPIAGTRFAAYNAVTEYVDHKQNIRGANKEGANVDTLRATRTILNLANDTDTTLKARAWSLLTN